MDPEVSNKPSFTAHSLWWGAKIFLGLFITVFLAALLAILLSNKLTSASTSSDEYGSAYDANPSGDSCNVIGIEIHGCIVTYPSDNTSSDSAMYCDAVSDSQSIVSYLENASKDDSIKGILIDIDSGGGSPVAAEEIADTLKTLQKPSVAWIRGTGASAAYWIASAATKIIASENSDVGSIGVTSSYLDSSIKDQKEGITYNLLSTGKFKDLGAPDKPLTQDERDLIMRDLKIIEQHFIATVAANRNLAPEKVAVLADGSTMLGAAAKENGLVDLLGTKVVADSALKDLIGEEPSVCWPQYN